MPQGSNSVSLLSPAPLAARFAALMLDLAAGAGLAILSMTVVLIWLLWQSDSGRRQPSDLAIYLALFLGSAWLPIWASFSVICWTRNGQTPGLAAMSLMVADERGRLPGVGRALARIVGVAAGVCLLLLAPLAAVALAAAAAQGTLPVAVAVGGTVLVLVAAVEPACCVLSRRRAALHDFATGTRVIRVVPQEFSNRVP